MSRRKFLTGFFGAWAGLSTCLSFEYLKNRNQNPKTNIAFSKVNAQRKGLNVTIELPIVYHCNLNCAACDHFASIAPVYKVPIDVFKKDIEKLSRITNKINNFWILGGEPLLHDKIEQIFQITRSNFPKAKIQVLTNGLLLHKKPDSFWLACNKNKIKITLVDYIYNTKDSVEFNNIFKKLKKFKCELSFDSPKYKFRRMSLTKEKVHEVNERYSGCSAKLWPIYDDGKFYPCTVVNGVEKFFNKKFPNYAIPISKDDVLDINKVKSIDDILNFYNKPKQMCAHCNYYLTLKGENWRPSKKEASEWYKVDET